MSDIEGGKAVKSIERVQEAESRAALILENAREKKESRLSDADNKARKIIDDGNAAASAISQEMLKKAEHELDQLRKKKLDDTRKAAAKIRKTRLSKARLEKLADQAVREIMGA